MAEKVRGIGLGWVLAIAIGGGVLLFAAIGFLLAWRIKAHSEPCNTQVYASNPDDPTSTRRLTKKRFITSTSSFGNLGSRLSLTFPPVLPPLPTYDSFRGRDEDGDEERGRRREKGGDMNWVDEEAMHGPAVNRITFRESWFSREGWLSRSPTLPNVKTHAEKQHSQQQQNIQQDLPTQVTSQNINVQKRQSKIVTSQTVPDLDADRGRSRVIAAAQKPPMRPCATETDLKRVLVSTEQRLREGNNRSPVKTPVKTPRSSPKKTPHSRSSTRATYRRSIHATPTPSPSKPHSRNASVTSIGSAANSLINLATQELQLPAGPRGKQWKPQPGSLPDPRRRSVDSDVSSSLSTLYSIGEAEDGALVLPAPQVTGPDPFVESRGLARSTRVSVPEILDESAIVPPLRTRFLKAGGTRFSLPPPTPSLPPPSPLLSEDVKMKSKLSAATSEASMMSVSVHSISSELTIGPETPNVEVHRRNRSDTSSLDTGLDFSSSPTGEREVLSILIASVRPRHQSYVTITDLDSPCGLSPSPNRRGASTSSSIYDTDSLYNTIESICNAGEEQPLPSGRSSLTVGNTVAQLRRMNSVVSSYSVASVASTISEPLNESNTATSRRGGDFSHDRKNSKKTAAMGNMNYRSLGGTSTSKSPSKKKGARVTPKGPRTPRSAVPVKKEKVEGKENQGLGLRVVRFDVPGLREGGQSANVSAPPSPDAETRQLERQSVQSVESIGLYDKDGFLKGSPNGKAMRDGSLRV